MVDMDWKAKMVSPDIPNKSPKLSNNLHISIPTSFGLSTASPASASAPACSAYDYYLRLPELRKLWSKKEFPLWETESIVKPALQALEISFRFVSIVLSDPMPYVNRREWKRRLETLATRQIELVAAICEDDAATGSGEAAPIAHVGSSSGVLERDGSSAEVWNLGDGAEKATFVSRTSEVSLLPRLAEWPKSKDTAEKILYSIECEMKRCPYTLGLGEPNLSGKPSLEYDAVCRPSELHALKRNPYDHIENHENQTLYTTHQILESWICASKELLKRIASRIEKKEFEKAASDCYLVERIWKLLAEIEDLHLLMDPEDFLKLKSQLQIKSLSQNEAFCFRSVGLVEITKLSKELKHKVPFVLGVEVDPTGGPRIQEAAMGLYREKREPEKIHLLQGLQAIEAALKRFFFAYREVVTVVMGSLELANSNRVMVSSESCDSLSQIFLEPTYYPSLDAAKTFLGEYWGHEPGVEKRSRRSQ